MPSVLLNGQRLPPGQFLSSLNNWYHVIFQTDGNLVLRERDPFRGFPVWSTGTHVIGANECQMHFGNLELLGLDLWGRPAVVWQSGTFGLGNDDTWLEIQDDRNLIIYKPLLPVWATNTVRPLRRSPERGRSALLAGHSLTRGQSLVSPQGGFKLTLQTDGNLVLLAGDEVLWATGTNRRAVSHCTLQADGNLVIYGPTGALWASGSTFYRNPVLRLQDDGNAVIYATRALWTTGTNR